MAPLIKFGISIAVLALASASLFGWGMLVRRLVNMANGTWPVTIGLGLGARSPAAPGKKSFSPPTSVIGDIRRMFSPVSHPVDSWGTIAVAAVLAVALESVIVLTMWRIDRTNQDQLPGVVRSTARDNAALVVFSVLFLALTVISGSLGDYRSYLFEWRTVLTGNAPWSFPLANTYGPLFNALALAVWIDPLANKLLWAFGYTVYLIWLIKDLAPRRGYNVLSSWWWMALWLLNPFPWEQIAYYGYFDIVVSLACVAAIHSLIRTKDGASGAWLGLSVLLKYFPIVALPFLAFNGRRFNFRLVSAFAGVVILGMALSVAVWGVSTFLPLMYAATREPDWSIYKILVSPLWPFSAFIGPTSVGWVEKPLLLVAGLGTFAWCYIRQTEPIQSSVLALLVTLLFYRVGHAEYQMVPFLLILYWFASNWDAFKTRPVLTVSVFGYFGFLAFEDFAWGWRNFGVMYHGTVMALVQFLLGSFVFLGLARFRPASIAQQQMVLEKRPDGGRVRRKFGDGTPTTSLHEQRR